MNDEYNTPRDDRPDSSDAPSREPYYWKAPNDEHTEKSAPLTGGAPITGGTPAGDTSGGSTSDGAPFRQVPGGSPGYTGSAASGESGPSASSGNTADSEGPAKKQKKNRKPMMRLVAFALVCALAGGIIGGIVGSAAGNSFLRPSASVRVSDRTVSKVKQVPVDGKTAMSNAENYAANVNSVVSINVGTETNFFGQTVEQASSGSGFVLTADGYILTNYHVVADATTIKITTYAGDTYEAEYIGGDEEYDIAVIKVDVKGLAPVVIGNSDLVNVGDDVIAVGNPLGELTFSLTSGSVSSANRAITVENTPFNMIQVDCSINPGNSGGPLFNVYGEVVGIVSAKYSSYANTTVEGLGFAIPINDVYKMVEDIMTNGYVTDKAYFGIVGESVNEKMQAEYSLPTDRGVYIFSIEPKGPAAKCDLRAGDIITKLDDSEINSMTDLLNAKKSYRAGDSAKMTVNRSGEELTLDFVFGTQPQKTPEQDKAAQPAPPAQEAPMPSDPQDLFEYFFGGNFFG